MWGGTILGNLTVNGSSKVIGNLNINDKLTVTNVGGNLNTIGTITSTSFIKSGGTNQQVLLADGTITTIKSIRAPKELTNENLNTFTTANGEFGMFYAAEGNTVTNVPPSFVMSGSQNRGFSVEVRRMGEVGLLQKIFNLVTGTSSDYQTYFRNHDGLSWSAWVKQ